MTENFFKGNRAYTKKNRTTFNGRRFFLKSRFLVSFFISFFFSSYLFVFQLASIARPETIAPNLQQNKVTGGKPQPAGDTRLLQQLDVTLPKPIDHDLTYFYPYNEGVSLNSGLFAVNAPDGTFPVYGIFSASYLWESLTAFHWETGFAFTGPGTGYGSGQLWMAGRLISHFTDLVRPYFSLGLGIKLRSEQGLANFVSLSNYILRPAAGFEYSFTKALSLRLEFFFDIDTLGDLEVGPTIGMSLGL